ncbi:hypothetical protein HYX14_01470 [Candidatus Woesearchaeota archaeon]|nr:hypothetical protein [Candidatus Woesearchaeota archaeon]
MFAHYRSLEELMSGPGRLQLQEQLNSFPLYLQLVREFGLCKIGVEIYDDDWKKIAEYSSYNNSRGEITDIVSDCQKTSITIGIQEQTILEVLRNPQAAKEEAERDTLRTFYHYLKLVKVSPWDLLKHAPKLVRNFPTLYSAARTAFGSSAPSSSANP